MTRLYVEARGQGPVLVLLHGWALNVRVWDPLVQALSDRFRIVSVDLPGHGQSEWAPDRTTLTQQAGQIREALSPLLGSSPYALLGWSLGAQFALRLAAGGPAGLDRLLLVGATPRFSAVPDWPYGSPAARLASLAEGLRMDYRRTVSEFLELQVRGSASGEAVLAQLREALFAHGEARPEALAAGLEMLRDTDLRPGLGGIEVPTMVIAGQYDRVVHPGASRALAQALPHARYVEIRRAAHAPFLSHSGQFAEQVTDFVAPQ